MTHSITATHFLFIREIPMLVSYQVRIYIASWGDKWVWIPLSHVLRN